MLFYIFIQFFNSLQYEISDEDVRNARLLFVNIFKIYITSLILNAEPYNNRSINFAAAIYVTET